MSGWEKDHRGGGGGGGGGGGVGNCPDVTGGAKNDFLVSEQSRGLVPLFLCSRNEQRGFVRTRTVVL